MATFVVLASTTIGADIISVNFGGQAIGAGATGDVGGVGAAHWVNIGGSADGSFNLTSNDGSGSTAGSMLLDVAEPAYSGGDTDPATVLGAMQKSYLDLGRNNKWVIDLNTDYMVSDVKLYFSGDGDKYAPVQVNGQVYKGGTNELIAEGETDWGNRAKTENGELDDDNTIIVTGVVGIIHAENVPQDTSAKRATLSGLQVVETELYSANLSAGANTASALTFAKGESSSALSGIAEAERYISVAGNADNSSQLALDVAVKGLQVTANTVTLTSAAGVEMLWAQNGTALNVSAALTGAPTLTLGGTGTITFTTDQQFGDLTIAGKVHLAENVAVEVTGDVVEIGGNLTIAQGASIYTNVAANTAKTFQGGMSVNMNKAWKAEYVNAGENPGNIIAVVGESATADVALSGSSSVQFSKSSTGDVTITLGSFNCGTTAGTQSISATDGTNVVGNFDGQLRLASNQNLTIGKGVSLSYKQSTADTGTGGRALALENASLTISGGRITAETLIMGDGGYNRTSNLSIDNGGYLEITSDNNSNGKHGAICLNHWSGSTANVSVLDGEFRSLAAKVNVSQDGNATNVTIGEQGAMNIKGIRMHNNTNITVSGKLNLGTLAIENATSGSVTINGGVLGALTAEGWSVAHDMTVGDGSTIQLAVYDVATKAYSGSADIALNGRTTMGGTIELAGSGTLLLSNKLAITGDTTLTGTGALTLQGAYELNSALTHTSALTTLDNFSNRGTGVLTLGAVNITGRFAMNTLGGAVTMESIVYAAGSSLVYGGEGSLLQLGALTGNVTLNLYGAADSLGTGVDLGFTRGTKSLDEIKAMLTVMGLSEYTLSEGDNGNVFLSSTAELPTDWDINWGKTLAGQPDSVTSWNPADGEFYDNNQYQYLYDVESNRTGDNVYLKLIGDATQIIVGGSGQTTSNIVGDIWLVAEEGTYGSIVAGSRSMWADGASARITGDTHILIKENASVTDLVGGMYGDRDAVLVGDSYISVMSGDVTGTIFGSSVNAHDGCVQHQGDSYVFVYTPLTGNGSIVGGSGKFTNNTGDAYLNGSTHVTYDLSSYTGDAVAIQKTIIGGHYYNCGNGGNNSTSYGAGQQRTITGTSHVTIKATDQVTYSGKVVGGSYITSGNNNKVGAISMELEGGIYTADVVAGSFLTSGSTSTNGATSLKIKDGEFRAVVYGGTYLEQGNTTISTGNVGISIEGGKLSSLSGGHFIGGGPTLETSAEAVTASISDISITVSDGEVDTLIGGTLSWRNNADSTIRQGNIAIDLKGGTVGDVYAAGVQKKETKLETASTSVTIGKDVTIAAGKTISGGYAFADGMSGSTVTGASALVLSGEQNRGSVNFKDFSTITNAAAATVGTLSNAAAVTKDGAGILTLAGAENTLAGGLTVSAGGLATSAATTLGGALTMGNGTSLDMTAGIITLTGDNSAALTLGQNLVLNVAAIAQESSATIISGISNTDLISGEVEASNYFASINGSSMLDEYFLKVDGNNLVLVRTAPVVPETVWTWEGEGDGDGGGVWGNTADNWAADTGATAATTDVSFTEEGAGTVEIDGAVAAKDIYVTGGGYTFTQKEGTTGGITADSMTIRGDSTSVTVENTNTIAATNLKGGTLVLSGEGTTGGNIVLGGGLLKYDGYTGTDVSSKVSLADNYTGPVKIEVVDDTSSTEVESVTWTKAAAGTANGGVDAILANGIVKTGAGNMTMTFQYTGNNTANTYAGAIDVQGGTLVYDAKVDGQALMTLSGNISVAKNAAFVVKTNRAANAQCVTLSGDLDGKGTVQLGTTGLNGRYYLSGDNSGFEGTIKIVGNDSQGNQSVNLLVFNGEKSFGGSATTVALNGRLLAFGGSYSNLQSSIDVESGQNNLLDGSSNTLTTLVFKGALTGNGTGVVFGTREKMKFDITMQGDVSDYQGKLSVGSATTWTLGGEDISSAGDVQATLTGTGTVKIQYNNATTISGKVVGTTVDGIAETLTLEHAGSGPLTVSGAIEGTANVKQSGAGTLVLTAENTTTGTMTIAEGRKVQLGTADAAAAWAGTTLAGAGTLEIVNGSLGGAMTRADGATASIAVNATGKTISLGGTDAGLLGSVTLGAGSQLTNVTGTLAVGSTPVQSRATTTASALSSLNLTLTTGNIGAGTAGTAMIEGAGITINDASKVVIDLSTDGVIDLLKQHRDATTDSYLTLTDGTLTCTNEQLQKLGIASTLMNYGIRLDGVSGGSIVASGKVDDIYFVTADDKSFPATVVNYKTLGMYKGTVIDAGKSLTITLEGDTDAATKATLNNLLGGTGSSLVVTNTSNTGVVTVELSNQAVADTGVADPNQIGTTTTMEGSITGNAGTELVKVGEGTLVVNGKVVADELEIQAGTLCLNNAENAVTTLNGTGGTLQLGSGSTLSVDGGALTDVALQAVPVATVAAGTPAAPVLEVNGNLSLLGTSRIDGIVLDVAEGKTLALAGTTNDVVALTGSGTVAGVSGTVLSLDNAAAATYSGALTGAGTLKVENGGETFTLKNASTSDWSITNAGKMVVDMTGSDTTPGSFACKALTLAGTSSTEFLLNTDNTGGIQLDSLTTKPGAAITITSTGENGIVLDADNSYVLDVAGSWDLAAGQTVTLKGMAFSRVGSTATLVDDAGQLKLQVAVSKENKYKSLAETKNGEAGAELMWNASMAEVAASPVLKELDTRLNAAAAAGVPQDELLASIAGASTAVLGMAVNNDVDRQLRAIRNRTTIMGVDQGVVNPEMPYYNAWINAEGGNNELRHSGTAGGYKLNSWGGTVGFDADFTPNLTAGLALTAMYGDLTVNGADQAKGDLDTYYVSAFARYCASAWTHTFVATAGLADMSLSRTVAGEEVEGDTNGMSFGLMYEAGRVFALNEDATACLQPILNVAWRHTTVDGYTEKGSDLGLKVDEQTYDSLTVGLGARLQAVVGESLYNRTSIFECRALVKAELGDHQGTSEVTLAGASAKVESAEMGSVGLEAGAGITIPLGDEGSSIFADASIEVYSGYTNVNGTVGYRINF